MAPALSVKELTKAFRVYFDEIERCRKAKTYWALLHLLVILPDICGALEDTGWATAEKHTDWCRRYCPQDVLTAEGYREVRDIVLHQGRTMTTTGRFYRFTQPGASGERLHLNGNIVVLDVDELAKGMIASMQEWVSELQMQSPQMSERRAKVADNPPTLVMAQEQGTAEYWGPNVHGDEHLQRDRLLSQLDDRRRIATTQRKALESAKHHRARGHPTIVANLAGQPEKVAGHQA